LFQLTSFVVLGSISMKNNNIKEKSYLFAIRTVKMYQYLTEKQKEYVLAKQVLRSGTSIGANIQEADAALSKADFSAKMSIAYKESQETNYWLRLLHDTGYIDTPAFDSMLNNCTELSKILFAILKSSGRIRKQ
jgi:four helix bundle protein